MDVTPLLCYYRPLRHPLVVGRLPGFSGYTTYLAPPISRWDEEGFSSFCTRPCHHAVASTPPENSIASISLRCQLSAFALTVAGSASGVTPFRGHICVRFHYGLMTRIHPFSMD